MSRSDPCLHLLVQGRVVHPIRHVAEGAVFELEATDGAIRLRSLTNRPARLGTSGDDRRLGYAVTRLVAIGANGQAVVEPAALSGLEGFHEFEPDGWCWTNGDAVLPAELLSGAGGRVTLEVHGFGLPDYVEDAPSIEDRALFNAFTSLGQDCEFGFAQRHFAAEPVSLFRWASTTAAQLVTGLEQAFEGLGDPEHTELEWRDNEQEYRIVDRRYLAGHTWIRRHVAAEEEAKLLRDGCARLDLLRRKLLHELADGRRIFVHRNTDPAFDRPIMTVLHSLLRQYGEASLLCVTPAFPCVCQGCVAHLGDGLMAASLAPGTVGSGPDPLWRAICLAAREMHLARG